MQFLLIIANIISSNKYHKILLSSKIDTISIKNLVMRRVTLKPVQINTLWYENDIFCMDSIKMILLHTCRCFGRCSEQVLCLILKQSLHNGLLFVGSQSGQRKISPTSEKQAEQLLLSGSKFFVQLFKS